jgi:hypothetical protein
MRLAVEAWAPEYGSALEEVVLEPTEAAVDEGLEVDEAEWAPIRPPMPTSPPVVLFVDGVQRIDAVVWLLDDDPPVDGRCASIAAGAVRCAPGEVADVVDVEVRRVLLSTSPATPAVETAAGTFHPVVAPAGERGDALDRALHEERASLEAAVVGRVADVAGTDVVVADGRLAAGLEPTGAVGYVKTHHRRYLSPGGHRVVDALLEGERTPLFRIEGREPRTSWYARLPGPLAHPWSGVVRLEVAGATAVAEAAAKADLLTALLPRFASESYKDGRAPQNLYPIGGLEKHLRHRMGDRELVIRALRVAAA